MYIYYILFYNKHIKYIYIYTYIYLETNFETILYNLTHWLLIGMFTRIYDSSHVKFNQNCNQNQLMDIYIYIHLT